MRAWISLLLISLVGLAGCASDSPTDPAAPSAVADPVIRHATTGLVEPADLAAPTFLERGAVAEGGPAYAMGEPGVWANLDGTLYVSIPGCDNLSLLLPGCDHGQIWRSVDDGVTWERMNQEANGRLTEDGPAANGDADVAVDSAGNIYVSNLGGGIQTHTYWAANQTWEYMANVVPDNESADRQWIAAAGPGHAIHTWMRTSPERDVEINTTFDGGRTWTGSSYFGDGIGWVGSAQFAPDGQHAYIPYTQPIPDPVLSFGSWFEMHVLHTPDGGLTWQDIPTGMTWVTEGASLHWSGGYMAPTLDVTGDGTVVVGMAVDLNLGKVGGTEGPVDFGTMLLWTHSRDNGTTWAESDWYVGDPVQPGAIVMPWITGGAGDRWAVTYYYAPGPAMPDIGGTVWNLEGNFFDRQEDGTYRTVHLVIDDDIHEGPLCNRGGSCAFPVDRTLLDYHESDLLPDGRLVVVYAADPVVDNQRNIQVRFAVQETPGALGVPA